jgi:hypothetical protein
MRRSRRLWQALYLIVALVGAVTSLTLPADAAVCGSYSNSSAHWAPDYGFVCAGTGGGCSECTEFGSGGYSVCVADSTGVYCIDYQY